MQGEGFRELELEDRRRRLWVEPSGGYPCALASETPLRDRPYGNGEVRRLGDYLYERELTLHKAITVSGGFTDKTSTSRAMVIFKIEGKEQEISLNLEGIILLEEIIVVSRSFF
jgi:hypothetical protein